MKKRAQGLSMRTIVVAIIALLVLVIILVIFSGQIGEVSKGFTDARESANLCRTDFLGGQKCVKEITDCPNNWEEHTSARCETPNYKCCKKKSG